MPTAIPVYYIPDLAMGSYEDLAAALGTSPPLLRRHAHSALSCACARANVYTPSLRGSGRGGELGRHHPGALWQRGHVPSSRIAVRLDRPNNILNNARCSLCSSG